MRFGRALYSKDLHLRVQCNHRRNCAAVQACKTCKTCKTSQSCSIQLSIAFCVGFQDVKRRPVDACIQDRPCEGEEAAWFIMKHDRHATRACQRSMSWMAMLCRHNAYARVVVMKPKNELLQPNVFAVKV